jgi:hypothetical protein
MADSEAVRVRREMARRFAPTSQPAALAAK